MNVWQIYSLKLSKIQLSICDEQKIWFFSYSFSNFVVREYVYLQYVYNYVYSRCFLKLDIFSEIVKTYSVKDHSFQ